MFKAVLFATAKALEKSHPEVAKWCARAYLSRARAKYDAVQSTSNRPSPHLERGGEETEFLIGDRMRAVSLGRDMHRNNAKYASMERLIALMTCSTVHPRVNYGASRQWSAKAQSVLDTWSKDVLCRIPRIHLSELCEMLVSATIREGDVLIVYDDGICGDTGRLLIYEADQLCRMDSNDFGRLYPQHTQTDGVVTDAYGCVVGYIVAEVSQAENYGKSRPSGLMTLTADKCMVVTTDQAVLLASRYRATQLRGVPETLPASIALIDSDNIVKSEALTAKRASKTFATVSMSAGTSQAMADEEAMQRVLGVVPEIHERKRYTNLEDDESAEVEYLDKDDTIQYHSPDRPNLDTLSFKRDLCQEAGASIGLTRGYTDMAVTNSYTAHRGESLLVWSSVRDRQKKLERTVLDWVAVKVLDRAIRLGMLPDADGWQDTISWDMPEMPAIDENAQINSRVNAIKAGLMTYADLFGPKWKRQMEQSAEEQEYARSLGLNTLSVFETTAGVPIEPEQGEQK